MTITRINHFQARAGQGERLAGLIGSFVDSIEASAGCHECRVLRGEDDPERIAVIETWESVEAHKAAAGNIPREAMAEAMTLLAGPPSGHYYRDP